MYVGASILGLYDVHYKLFLLIYKLGVWPSTASTFGNVFWAGHTKPMLTFIHSTMTLRSFQCGAFHRVQFFFAAAKSWPTEAFCLISILPSSVLSWKPRLFDGFLGEYSGLTSKEFQCRNDSLELFRSSQQDVKRFQHQFSMSLPSLKLT